jgi:mono/diheme cytochrome c family protein
MRGLISVAGVCLCASVVVIAAQPQPERTWVAPPSADSRQNPLEKQPEILAGGSKVFRQRCAFCHGQDGTGNNRGPNLMTRQVLEQSDGSLFWKISSGNTRTGMPAFSFLPEAQRWQLVSHLRAQAHE